jgi:predicted transcriptional regulator
MAKLHPIATKLLADIEAYRARVGIDRTAFGVKAAGDGHFISRVEEGKIPRITTIDRVYAYMDGKTKAVTPKEAVRAAIARLEYYPSGRRKPFRKSITTTER